MTAACRPRPCWWRRGGAKTSCSSSPQGSSHRPRRLLASPVAVAPAPVPEKVEPVPVAEAKPRGKLSIETNPWTRVLWNGRALGETPLIPGSAAGGEAAAQLFVNDEKGISKSVDVTIQAGKTTVVRFGRGALTFSDSATLEQLRPRRRSGASTARAEVQRQRTSMRVPFVSDLSAASSAGVPASLRSRARCQPAGRAPCLPTGPGRARRRLESRR